MATTGLHAAEKRVITHEDLWLMPRVGAPVTSPDGANVAFQLLEPAYKKEEQVADLWLVPSDGREPPRRITSGKGGEDSPAWSNDSHRLAFSAKRGDDKQAQIYIIDLARGGEAQRATKISTGATMPQFSPNGLHVLFVSNVYPEALNDADSERLAKEKKDQKFKARTYTSYPIRNWDKWIDEKQAHLFVQRIGEQDARDLLAGSALIKLPGFDLAKGSARWTPDGKAVVFAASRNRDRAAWSFTHDDLWMVSINGDEPRRLTGAAGIEAGDSWEAPEFSRDGRSLFAIVEPRTDKVYNAPLLGMFDWPSMRERGRIRLPEGRKIADFAISPDGKHVDLLGEDAGQLKLFRAATRSGEAQLIGAPAHGMVSDLSMGGTRSPVLIAVYESATEPPEIVRLNPNGVDFRRLSSFARSKAAALDLPPVENFWFTNERGQRIHNMIVRPPAFDPRKKYPLLVLMHGGPYSQWHDAWVLRWNYHLLSADGYVLLLTNYVGSTSGSEAFAQAIQGDPLKGPADDINQAADEAIRRYSFIDANRQCAAGASYGGHLANWLQGTTTRYRCLISHAGLVNLESQWGTSDHSYGREIAVGGPVWEQNPIWREQNPIRLAANFKTPVLVSFGEKDFRVPLNNGLEYWTALQRQQVESKLIIFPDENHWIMKGEDSRYYYAQVRDWLKTYLEPTSPPLKAIPAAASKAE
ncbi:MAG TPA: S9 family peptidase [Dokdonella sp.]|uniref:S9 family peptidase n=1 Tax=Dokdonella sp. TaxID=2291710 RepID=UPI002D808010|nr:S9 family peptidase [Dokdonella sp.]HET9033615.1 S9 family peptidase [Dokdonella sp.]